DDLLLIGPNNRMDVDHHDDTEQTADRQGVSACASAHVQLDVEQNACQHRHGGSMTEPVQRGGHELWNDNVFRWAIQAFEEGRIDQVEEVEQPDPGDAGQEVDPADNDSSP